MDKNKKGAGKLATYATALILMIIIVIIIAAMADDRERNFQSQIDQTTQANMTIQDEIVSIKDENYSLKQEIEQLKPKAELSDKLLTTLTSLNEAVLLFNDNKKEEAAAKYAELDPALIPEELLYTYNSVGELLGDK